MLNKDYSDAPARILSLPRDSRGFPVPWFVAYIDGKPDFRFMDEEKFVKAIKQKKCWTCGEPLGRNMSFVSGPMCGINRTSAEPPSHRDCAIFSAKACPFLSQPKMKRNEKNVPAEAGSAGMMIKRNPGVTLIWTTRKYKPFSPPGGGVLIEMGPPTEVLFFRESRKATREEILESISSGIHLLENLAKEHDELPALEKAKRRFMALVPSV